MNHFASSGAPTLKIVPYQAPGIGRSAGESRKRRRTQSEGQNSPSLKIRNACNTCREYVCHHRCKQLHRSDLRQEKDALFRSHALHSMSATWPAVSVHADDSVALHHGPNRGC